MARPTQAGGTEPCRPTNRITRLDIYVGLVAAGGAAAITHSLVALRVTPQPIAWIAFAILAVATGSFTVKFASISATISVSDTFYITSVLLFGPAPSTVALAMASAIVSWRRRYGWRQFSFNTVAPALALWAAGHAFFLLAQVAPLAVAVVSTTTIVAPLACLAGLYFLLNSGMIAVAIGLDERRSPVRIWWGHFVWLSVGYFAAGSVSLCMILLIQHVGFVAALVVLPLLIVFHLTFRSTFGRLEDARIHVQQIDHLYLSTVETLAMAIDAKDDVTHSHVRRVQGYALGLARALGVTDEPTLKAIEAAALLHDTGKLAVPEHILNKPGKLTEAEFEQMKLHVDVGADILSRINFPYPVVPIVRCHHENWNGTGYPRGVTGEAIPIGARILSVVDCFDALTSDRPYRRRMTADAALDILRARRGSMYDPRVVDTFIAIHQELSAIPLVQPPLEQAALSHISRAAVAAEPVAPPSAGEVNTLGFASLARLVQPGASVDDVLTVASMLLGPLPDHVTAAWYVYDPSVDRLQAIHATGPAAGGLAGTWIRVGERLTGWVAAQRRPSLNSDAALDLGDRASTLTPRLQSCASVPLPAGATIAGVLTLYSNDEAGFTEEDLRRLQAIASYAGAALAAIAPSTAPNPTVPGAPRLHASAATVH